MQYDIQQTDLGLKMDVSFISYIKSPLNFSEPQFPCLLVGNHSSTINFQMIAVKANDPNDKHVSW